MEDGQDVREDENEALEIEVRKGDCRVVGREVLFLMSQRI